MNKGLLVSITYDKSNLFDSLIIHVVDSITTATTYAYYFNYRIAFISHNILCC